MSMTAARVVPAAPEMMPGPGGRLEEIWRVTHDGSDVDVTITTDFIDYIESALGADFSHDITSSTRNQVTLTFAAALTNALTQDVRIIGRKN